MSAIGLSPVGKIFYPAVTQASTGAEFTISVPAGVKWKILSIVGVLTTDATATDRNVLMTIATPASVIWFVQNDVPVDQNASLLRVYLWYADFPANQVAFDNGGRLSVWLPPFFIPEGSTIATLTTNLQAGDAYTSFSLTVEELPM